MKVILQRVKEASVTVEGQIIGQIAQGLLLLVGVAPDDDQTDIDYAVRKIVQMRIFADESGKMNRSVQDIGGSILSVSQFTLFAETKKGNRPAFNGGAPAALAQELYERFNHALQAFVSVETGRFGADMQVSLINDGPVTVILDTKSP